MSVIYSNFIVNERNKVIFAYVPKVACSNWKGIMRALNGETNYLNTNLAHDREKSGLLYLSQIEDKKAYLEGSEYTRLAFVRNPYSRVLSAYLNKIDARLNKQTNNPDHFDRVVADIDEFRKLNLECDKYPAVSFEVFLLWLKQSRSIYTFDEHWKSQTLLLDYKHVHFTKIGKFEELTTEAGSFIELLGAEVSFPSQKDIKFEPTKASDKLTRYYNEDSYELVSEIYKDDFINFGYSFYQKEQVSSPGSFNIHGVNSRIIEFPAGEHYITEPIEIGSFDVLAGQGQGQTILRVVGNFNGPVIKTVKLTDNVEAKNWFYEEGVPVRFVIKDLTIDLSGWHPPVPTGRKQFQYADFDSAGIGLYGKCYQIKDVSVINAPGAGFVSACSSRGGKKDFYLDSPESSIGRLEIVGAKKQGVVLAGPHDSILKEIITCHTKGKGVHIIADEEYSGACDIDFIHAYASDDIAIDIDAKVKARFLQGDTGRHAGVRITGSNKTIVETIEAFKTRGNEHDYSVEISSSEAQIGMVRIRADAGANGLKISGPGNIIQSLHIEALDIHPNFAHLGILRKPIALLITDNSNTIVTGRLHVLQSPAVVTEGIQVNDFTCNLNIQADTHSVLRYTNDSISVDFGRRN